MINNRKCKYNNINVPLEDVDLSEILCYEYGKKIGNDKEIINTKDDKPERAA